MTITQTVEVPDTRMITLKVPSEVPTGRTNIVIQFPLQEDAISLAAKKPDTSLPVPDRLPGGNYSTVEEAIEAAAKDAADPNRKPISQLFGTLPNHTFGDPVAYQRAIRDEWND